MYTAKYSRDSVGMSSSYDKYKLNNWWSEWKIWNLDWLNYYRVEKLPINFNSTTFIQCSHIFLAFLAFFDVRREVESSGDWRVHMII